MQFCEALAAASHGSINLLACCCRSYHPIQDTLQLPRLFVQSWGKDVTLNVFLQSAGLDDSAVGGGGSRSARVGSVFGGTRVAIVGGVVECRPVGVRRSVVASSRDGQESTCIKEEV